MIRIEGRGLHAGADGAVTFEAVDGPTTLGLGDDRAAIAALRFVGGDRGTDVFLPSGRRVRTVEHLLAAVAGMASFQGVRVSLEGDEVPLADGGARQFADALAGLARPGPSLVITHDASFSHGEARLSVSPFAGRSVEVVVDFPAERFGVTLAGTAQWNGSPESFVAEIAPSRTFGAKRELEALRARGLAAYVPEGVVVGLDVEGRRPRDPGEPIRHKLLDALGDLATLGAPIVGSIRVERPSHAAIHAILPGLRAQLQLR